MGTLIGVVITLLILALIVWFAFWIIDMIPGPPGSPFPMLKIALKVIIGLIVLLYLLSMLTGYAPLPAHLWR